MLENTSTPPWLTWTKKAHLSWQPLLVHALSHMDEEYLSSLTTQRSWLPGPEQIFNAFSIPQPQCRFLLLGESPYPRAASANGYAFWDQAVGTLWSTHGLSKLVNRATSLRHWMKMLLIAEGRLQPRHTTPADIARMPKEGLVHTLDDLFRNMLRHGFLLLNATLVLDQQPVRYHVQQWAPFLNSLLCHSQGAMDKLQLILLGRLAASLLERHPHLPQPVALLAEHPYNQSFVTNSKVIHFFQPLHLLQEQTAP